MNTHEQLAGGYKFTKNKNVYTRLNVCMSNVKSFRCVQRPSSC